MKLVVVPASVTPVFTPQLHCAHPTETLLSLVPAPSLSLDIPTTSIFCSALYTAQAHAGLYLHSNDRAPGCGLHYACKTPENGPTTFEFTDLPSAHRLHVGFFLSLLFTFLVSDPDFQICCS
jgi:hypothetical protein